MFRKPIKNLVFASILLAIALGGLKPTPVAAGNCIPGKQVDKNAFFAAVARKLVNPSMSETALAKAVQAFIAWEPYENTNACWNPLATTLKKSGSTKFNSAGVQNYPDFETGVQATADTLNLTLNGTGAYYAAIRNMMALQNPDWTAVKTALKGWVGSDSYSTIVTNKWKTIYSPCVGCGVSNVFQNGSSILSQDQNWGRANLKVCAANLPGQMVYVRFFRYGREWTYSQRATSTCVIFWDMDGAGPLNRNTTYFSQAALNQQPNPAWPIPCAGATGGQGLCDKIYRP